MGKRKFQSWVFCPGTLRHLTESIILLYWVSGSLALFCPANFDSQVLDDSGMLRWPLVVSLVSYSQLWAMLGEPQNAPHTISITIPVWSRQCMVIIGWGTTLNVFESLTTLKRPNIKIYLMSSGKATTPLWRHRGQKIFLDTRTFLLPSNHNTITWSNTITSD